MKVLPIKTYPYMVSNLQELTYHLVGHGDSGSYNKTKYMPYSLSAQTAFFFYIGEGKGSGQVASSSWQCYFIWLHVSKLGIE